jgi:2-hydroxychromene-2-carboxylate isomerase
VSIGADLETAKLSVLLDLRHPLAYLALGPALALERELDFEINWLPIVTQPLNAPTDPGPNDDRGIRHRRNRAQAIAREIETYAAMPDLVLRDYYRTGSVEAASRGWLWMRERHRAQLRQFLLELFRAYWSGELDPSVDREIATHIEGVSGDGSDYLDWSLTGGDGAVRAVADQVAQFGLFSAPAYVVDGDVFFGRQHLSMVRWILAGRSGPIPI